MTSQINLCAESAVTSITFERFVFVTCGVFLQKISLPKRFPTNPTNVIGFSSYAQLDYVFLEILTAKCLVEYVALMQSILVLQVLFKVSFTTNFAPTYGAKMVLRSMFLRLPLLLVPHALCLFSLSLEKRGRDGKVYFLPTDQTRIVPNTRN